MPIFINKRPITNGGVTIVQDPYVNTISDHDEMPYTRAEKILLRDMDTKLSLITSGSTEQVTVYNDLTVQGNTYINSDLQVDGNLYANGSGLTGITIGGVDGLTDSLINKSPVGHGHIISNITGLQVNLDTKIPYTGATSNIVLGDKYINGTFIGNGAGLTGITAGGIVGLSLNQISSGNVVALVSNTGFTVNSGATFSGTVSATNIRGSAINTGDETASTIRTKIGNAATSDSTGGYLTYTDYTAFNNKQSAGSYEVTTNKNAVSGYTGLDANGQILNSQHKTDLKGGTGVQYNGTNQYHSVAHNSNIETSSFSVQWFGYINNNSNSETLFSKFTSGLVGYKCTKSSGNYLDIYQVNGSYSTQCFRLLCDYNLLTSGFYHIVIIFDPIIGNNKVYLNGRNIIYSQITATLSTSIFNSNPLTIGSYNTQEYFSGSISILRYFNYSLSSIEAATLWNGGKPLDYKLPYSFINANNTVKTNGSLLVGKQYKINNYISGDNFTNSAIVVSGTINTSGCVFIASRTTPTTWTNGSSLIQIGTTLSLDVKNSYSDEWLSNSNNYVALPINNPIVLLSDNYGFEKILSEYSFLTNITSGVANKDLTLPANYYVDSIQIENSNNGSLTGITVTANATSLDSQSTNVILSNKTVISGRQGLFTTLSDQVIYLVDTVLRLNATGNSLGVSIIYNLKRQA